MAGVRCRYLHLYGKGERHGISFFPQYQHPEVEYTPGEQLTFDVYHTVDVMYYWYKKWAQEYPEIVDLYEIERSFEGRPILQMTITNKETGKDTDKPAAYFEGEGIAEKLQVVNRFCGLLSIYWKIMVKMMPSPTLSTPRPFTCAHKITPMARISIYTPLNEIEARCGLMTMIEMVY